MKTLADVKRRTVVGTQLEVVAHWQPRLVGTTRTVTKVRTVDIICTSSHDPDKDFHSQWSKAGDVLFITENEIAWDVIVGERTKTNRGICHLRFIEDGPA